MRTALFLMLGAMLLYSLFLKADIPSLFFVLLSVGISYLIYRVPARYIVAMKYPVIFLLLSVTVLFLIYPHLKLPGPMEGLLFFISFYSVSYFLITIDEKERGLFKEATALSVVFLCSAFNMSMVGKAVFILPIAFAGLIFLFILGKNRLLVVLAFLSLVVTGLMINKGVALTNPKTSLNDMNRYMVLTTSFIFLMIGFASFVKSKEVLKKLSFFGFLYLAVDIIMTLALKISMGLLYQPFLALFVLTPLIGVSMKRERGAVK
ncbi:MAG: hypothetical protein N2745_00695 [Syntrophorhabdaceae bacterium]|nr:hypothetical protein [Syntrophorhabdaceae bacterium]